VLPNSSTGKMSEPYGHGALRQQTRVVVGEGRQNHEIGRLVDGAALRRHIDDAGC
jgi:hypothetical protein